MTANLYWVKRQRQITCPGLGAVREIGAVGGAGRDKRAAGCDLHAAATANSRLCLQGLATCTAP